MLPLLSSHSGLLIHAQSDTIMARSLAATTAETVTIPAGANYVIISPSTSLYFRMGTSVAATVPGDVTDGTAAELIQANPTLRAIVRARTTGTITTATALLTVASTDGMTVGDTLVVTGAGAAGADLTQTISSINQTTKVVTLGGNASTSVVAAVVTESVTEISVISPNISVVTLSFYK
jgi:hypothetical protein